MQAVFFLYYFIFHHFFFLLYVYLHFPFLIEFAIGARDSGICMITDFALSALHYLVHYLVHSLSYVSPYQFLFFDTCQRCNYFIEVAMFYGSCNVSWESSFCADIS